MLHSVTFDPTEVVMREIEKSLTALGLDDVHIAEIFCPGRFTAQASLFGLIPGTAMDLRTGWDFNLPENRRRAEQCVKSERPALLVGSPKCGVQYTSELESRLPAVAGNSPRGHRASHLRMPPVQNPD